MLNRRQILTGLSSLIPASLISFPKLFADIRIDDKIVYFKHGKDVIGTKNGYVCHTIKDAGCSAIEESWFNANGELHSENDLPAVITRYKDEITQEWYQNGLLHRDNDLPAITHPNGTKEWYQFNQRHRVGGPAYIANSCWTYHEGWYYKDNRHRTDGPAETSVLLPESNGCYVFSDGMKAKAEYRYYFDGYVLGRFPNEISMTELAKIKDELYKNHPELA
jgi:hypothetical protein